ncbi:hypothetical protein V6N13_125338 [Hibiscus sabdariffa]|uniref:Uncharacterized protein n=1 Tax=Hibiscus sabdariffa TaxID=183260 RepID=A0ABR2U5B8_9ROSI
MDACGSVHETPASGICSETAGLCLLSPVLEIIEDYGEQEENFFDSRGWVRSDSEDEYFSNICSHEAPETKKLVELFQDPFWSDVLTQRPKPNNDAPDKNKIQLVELLEGWSWKKEQGFRLSSVHFDFEPSIIVKGFDGSRCRSRKNSTDGDEGAQTYKSKPKMKTPRYTLLLLHPNSHTSGITNFVVIY